MRKQIRRKGYLIQKNREKEITPDNISRGHASAENFRITAIMRNQNSERVWIVGEYKTFREAKFAVDNFPVDEVSYYVHADSSRILYSRKGLMNA